MLSALVAVVTAILGVGTAMLAQAYGDQGDWQEALPLLTTWDAAHRTRHAG